MNGGACDDRQWLGRIVGVDSGSGAIAERLVRDFPSAVTIARLSDERVIADSDLATTRLGCASPRVGERLSRRWLARRDFDAFMARFLSSGRIDRMEIRLQRNDGKEFWCSVCARLIEAGGQPFILLHMLDLTDQIAARAEISRQRDALHDAEKLSALGQLLGGISHELNNPLSVLAGQALMLKEKAVDEATAKRADRILNAAQKCSRIVRSFLDLARGEPADPVPVDLNELVVEAIEATIDTLRGAGIEPVLELPKGLPLLLGEPDQIRQVIINLIVNALQAMSGETGLQRISIRTRLDPATGGLVLKVSDNGPGVPAAISSRIFDPLFTTKAPGKGTGLGLTLCRRIMEAHGGTIDLDRTSAGLGDVSLASSLRAIDEARPGAAASVIFIADSHAGQAVLHTLDQLERPYLKEPFDRRELRRLALRATRGDFHSIARPVRWRRFIGMLPYLAERPVDVAEPVGELGCHRLF